MTNKKGALGIDKAKSKGGQQSLKTVIVDYPPPFYRHIKIGSEKDVFALEEARDDHRNKFSRLGVET